VVLVDDGQPIAAGWAVPIASDGTVADLPAGHSAALQRAVQGREAGTPTRRPGDVRRRRPPGPGTDRTGRNPAGGDMRPARTT